MTPSRFIIIVCSLILNSLFLILVFPPPVRAQSCTDTPDHQGPYSILFDSPEKHCSFNATQQPDTNPYYDYITHTQVTCAQNNWLPNEMLEGEPPDLTGGGGDSSVQGSGEYIKNFDIGNTVAGYDLRNFSRANSRLTSDADLFDLGSFAAACLFLGYDDYSECAKFYQETLDVSGQDTFVNYMRTGNPNESLSSFPMRYTETKRLCEDNVIPCANRGQTSPPGDWCSHVYCLDESCSTTNLDVCQMMPDTFEEAVKELSEEELKQIWAIRYPNVLIPGYLVFAPNTALTNIGGCNYLDPNESLTYQKLQGTITRFGIPGLYMVAKEGIPQDMALMTFSDDVKDELEKAWNEFDQPFSVGDNSCNLIKPECISNLNQSPDFAWAISRINTFQPCVPGNNCKEPSGVQPSGAGFAPPGGMMANLFGIIAEILSGPRFIASPVPLWSAWFVVPGETKEINLSTYENKLAQYRSFVMPTAYPTLIQDQQVAINFNSRARDNAENIFTEITVDDEGNEESTEEEALAAGGSGAQKPVVFPGANNQVVGQQSRYKNNNLLSMWWTRDRKDRTCYLDDILDKSPPASAQKINAIARTVGALSDRRYCESNPIKEENFTPGGGTLPGTYLPPLPPNPNAPRVLHYGTAREIAARYNIDPCILEGIAAIESGGGAVMGSNSCGGYNCCNSSCACGPMQMSSAQIRAVGMQGQNICDLSTAYEAMARFTLGMMNYALNGGSGAHYTPGMEDSLSAGVEDIDTIINQWYLPYPTHETQVRWGEGVTYADALRYYCQYGSLPGDPDVAAALSPAP